MQQYGMLILIGVVLLTFFNFFLLVMCFKTWRIMQIFATFFVFAAAIAFCVFATISLKTNAAWKEKIKELRSQLAEAEIKKEALEYGRDVALAQKFEFRTVDGEPVEITGDKTEFPVQASHLAAPHKLWRATYDQGQVLRNCKPGAFNNSVTVTTFTPTEADQPVERNGLTPSTIVHVFKEVDWSQNPELKLPKVYLGAFEVTAATDTNATLSPVKPLDKYQDAQAKIPNSTWTLYTQMPRDHHYAFIDDDMPSAVEAAKEDVRQAELALAEAKRAANSADEKKAAAALKDATQQLADARANAQPLWGMSMERDRIAAMLPNQAFLKQLLPRALFPPPSVNGGAGMTDAEYDALIKQKHDRYLDRYLHDGRPVKDIAAEDSDFDVGADTYQRVRFKLDAGTSTEDIVVDSTTTTDPLADDPFDNQGRAKPETLRQGGPTKFTNVYDIDERFKNSSLGPNAVDDVGVFDQLTADDMVATGRAEKLDDQFFVRPLTDYEYEFQDYFTRDENLNDRRKEILAATKRAVDSAAQAQQQLDVRRTQYAKLESDLAKFKTDQDIVTRERISLEAAKDRQTAMLRGLYQEITAQLARLNQLQQYLSDEVARKAAMASAAAQ